MSIDGSRCPDHITNISYGEKKMRNRTMKMNDVNITQDITESYIMCMDEIVRICNGICYALCLRIYDKSTDLRQH